MPRPTNAPARVLTGVQPSGRLHLGNYVGAIRPCVELQESHELFLFVASYHALTSTRDPDALRDHIRQAVVDYLAFGIDPQKTHIYLQHDVPRVTELAWLLGCVCPKSQMDKAVSYKDKTAKGLNATIGLYTYPVLQAADILAVDPDLVPVGEDQRQHVEITRDLAGRFNHQYGQTFKLPEPRIRGGGGAGGGMLPGTDGQKMSKSYGNGIDPFLPEKKLRKLIMKITTDSTPMEEAKDPAGDTVFQMFQAVAGEDDPRTAALAERYRSVGAVGMGYSEAKQSLYELLMDQFQKARSRRGELERDPGYIDSVLRQGGEKAGAVIEGVVTRAKAAVGLG